MPRGCGRLQSVKRRAAAAADDDEDDDDNDGDIDIEEDLVYKLTEAVKKQYGTIYVHTQRKLLSYVVQQYQASTCYSANNSTLVRYFFSFRRSLLSRAAIAYWVLLSVICVRSFVCLFVRSFVIFFILFVTKFVCNRVTLLATSQEIRRRTTFIIRG